MADTAIKQEDETAKRALRRKRHDIEVEQLRCWELKKNLADISAEVELLTQEVRSWGGTPVQLISSLHLCTLSLVFSVATRY